METTGDACFPNPKKLFRRWHDNAWRHQRKRTFFTSSPSSFAASASGAASAASVIGLCENSCSASPSLLSRVSSDLPASSFIDKTRRLGSTVTLLMRTFVGMPTKTSFKKLSVVSFVDRKPVVYAVVPGTCTATTIDLGGVMRTTWPSNHSLGGRVANGDTSASASNMTNAWPLEWKAICGLMKIKEPIDVCANIYEIPLARFERTFSHFAFDGVTNVDTFPINC